MAFLITNFEILHILLLKRGDKYDEKQYIVIILHSCLFNIILLTDRNIIVETASYTDTKNSDFRM